MPHLRAPSDPEILTGLGMELLRSGAPEAALPLFQEAIRGGHDHADAFLGLGAVALDQARTADAIAAFGEALRVAPGDARVHNELGVAYASLGDLERAIECFEAAQRLDPDPGVAANLERARTDRARRSEPRGRR